MAEDLLNLLDKLSFEITTTRLDQIQERQNAQLMPLSRETLNLIYSRFPITTINIYYPVSRYQELDPIGIQYNIPEGVRPLDILGAISTFYHRSLTEQELARYAELGEQYQYLVDEAQTGNPMTVADMMFGLVFSEGLQPYRDGYILDLGS